VQKDAVVSVDCSTSASKAIVWDRAGRPLAEGRVDFSLLNPQPSREHSARTHGRRGAIGGRM